MGTYISKPTEVIELDTKPFNPKYLYAFGSNHEGQCGKNNGYILREKSIVLVSAGYSHNLALLKNHELIAWGSNDYGQSGIKNIS